MERDYIHLAEELDRLLNVFIDDLGDESAFQLRQFLWENKIGILRALQMLPWPERAPQIDPGGVQ